MATSQYQNQSASLADQIKQCLKEPFPEAGSMPKIYIHSEQDFAVKMEAYRSLCNQDKIQQELEPELDGFPSDVETQRQLVQQLVDAMTDVNNAQDKDAKIPLGRIKKLSPIEFNLMAWTVLLEVRDIQRGQISLPRWGKDWEWQECHSFYHRFELVKSALRSHKTVVSSLFDYPFVKRLALHPAAELDRKKSNKVLNWKRKHDLALAKKLKLEQKAAKSRSRQARSSPRRRTRAPSSASPALSVGQAQQTAPVGQSQMNQNGNNVSALNTRQNVQQAPVTNAMRPHPQPSQMPTTAHNQWFNQDSLMQGGEHRAETGGQGAVAPELSSALNTQIGPGQQWPATTQTVNNATFTMDSSDIPQQAPVLNETQTPNVGRQHQFIDSQHQYMRRIQSAQAPSTHCVSSAQRSTQGLQLASSPQSFTNVHQWLNNTVQAEDTSTMNSAGNHGMDQGFLQTLEYSTVRRPTEEFPASLQGHVLQPTPAQSNDTNDGHLSDEDFQKLLESPLDAGMDQWWEENGHMFDLGNN